MGYRSKTYSRNSEFYKLSADFKSTLDLLKLDEIEVWTLFDSFQILDVNNEGYVTYDHLMLQLGEFDLKNNFLRRMMKFKKGINFEGFLLLVWDICSQKQSDLGTLRD
jgi:Ca2+-binding EF-hand superfamily protein